MMYLTGVNQEKVNIKWEKEQQEGRIFVVIVIIIAVVGLLLSALGF